MFIFVSVIFLMGQWWTLISNILVVIGDRIEENLFLWVRCFGVMI